MATRLGLSPKSLIGEKVEFVWRDRARFKNLRKGDQFSSAALSSFGTSIGRSLIAATPEGAGLQGVAAAGLREMLLSNGAPDLMSLLTACWATGTPAVQLKISPIPRKAMHALVVGYKDRHAVLLSREASYPAQAAFTLAHEIGHIALGHVPSEDVLVDAEDPGSRVAPDEQEVAADRFALELLLGDPDPDIRINFSSFNHQELADAVLRAAPSYGIDPGTLALAVAFKRNVWPTAMAALRLIYHAPVNVSLFVNRVALTQLALGELSADSSDFLLRVLGQSDE